MTLFDPPEQQIKLNVRCAAALHGMTVSRLDGVSTTILLKADNGIEVKLPLPEFDWMANGDVIFVNLGFFKPFLEGLGGPTDAVQRTESGLILPGRGKGH